MTTSDRRRRSNRVCEKFNAEVAEIIPAGFAQWDEGWSMVDPAVADFVAALTAWDSEPNQKTMAAIRRTYASGIEAWRAAAAAFNAREGAER